MSKKPTIYDAPAIINNKVGLRTFQMVQYVSGYIEGEFNDWPAQLQDPVLEALERKAGEVELPLTVVYSVCQVEPPIEPGQPDKFFIHVIASEIVARDTRFMKGQAQGIIADIISGKAIH